MGNNEIIFVELSSKFSVIIERMPELPSGALVILFKQGSRNELPQQAGITNLLLGLLFRQTTKKTFIEIQEYIDSLGAELDSFVAKEISGIYSRYLVDRFNEVWSLTEEIIFYPKFTEEEFTKEKKLTEKEIISEEDDPEEYLFNVFYKNLFPNHPLSNRIIGDMDSITQLVLDEVRNYYSNCLLYAPICVSITGNIDPDFVLKLAEQMKNLLSNLFGLINHNDTTQKDTPTFKPLSNFVNVKKKGVQQSYTVIGWYTCPYQSEYYFPVIFANTILGGCTSSRLYYEVREKRGLAYSISSFTDFYSDIGILGVYFITQPDLAEAVTEIVLEQTHKLRLQGISKDEFDLARNYVKSQTLIRTDNPLARALRNARNKLLINRIPTVSEIINEIENVSLIRVNEAIGELSANQLIVRVEPSER
ncbi:MAG: pitrilysin family protein [candidate division WOR-3 bacterium]|nr:insulinase family protein [candidate division WOR-3 bacterium]MDW7987116.1 pitrilysin family protein [candidate division WOR-3 bacterium]